VRHVSETGSTNADLMDLARSGAPAHSVLAADHQTAGRGRLDRTWEAPPGANLLVSLLFRDHLDAPHRHTQRVALAAARACEQVAGVRPLLKWPNDLLVGDQKLAGILAQAGGVGGGPSAGPALGFVVVGIGLNVGWAPPGAARLGRGSPPDVLARMLAELDDLDAPGRSVPIEYRERLDTIGRRVRVELPGEIFVGRALDVEPDGALVVEHDGSRRRVEAGDVVHLRVTNG
jgi:BirA family biotin operon repressor/biotin-[acetyl-CoA-carboxylase] ligase